MIHQYKDDDWSFEIFPDFISGCSCEDDRQTWWSRSVDWRCTFEESLHHSTRSSDQDAPACDTTQFETPSIIITMTVNGMRGLFDHTADISHTAWLDVGITSALNQFWSELLTIWPRKKIGWTVSWLAKSCSGCSNCSSSAYGITNSCCISCKQMVCPVCVDSGL